MTRMFTANRLTICQSISVVRIEIIEGRSDHLLKMGFFRNGGKPPVLWLKFRIAECFQNAWHLVRQWNVKFWMEMRRNMIFPSICICKPCVFVCVCMAESVFWRVTCRQCVGKESKLRTDPWGVTFSRSRRRTAVWLFESSGRSPRLMSHTSSAQNLL